MSLMTRPPRRRFLALLAIAPALLAGCAGRPSERVGLDDVASLASEALLGTLLGPSPEKRVTMMAPPEPPLLVKGVAENVLLSTDYADFARASKKALSEKDVKAVEADVLRTSGAVLKKRGFAIGLLSYPPVVDPAAQNTLVATLTPVTEEGGSPDEKRNGRGRTYVLIRLTITDPRTNTVLRVRDFYSGREAGK